ncbi:tRNA (adenosine(37)-N6)-dimethylallyltransferase MiaA [Parapedomonas caeni]
MTTPLKPLVLIAGPTASGKSALALHLAERSDGVIINADALQLYADLRVLSARPSPEEEARAPHRLYGVLDGNDISSAAWWAEAARREIEAAWAAARLPIVIGGTGLYLRTLMDGIVAVPDIPEAVRADVRTRMAALGPEALHAELARLDPACSARLMPRDRQRISRALEVVLATGRPLSDWQAEPQGGLAGKPGLGPVGRIILLPARDWLYARCDRRFAQMIEAGAADEVAALIARNLPADRPVMKAVGVRELAAWQAGQLSKDAAIDAAARETRRYAKRQYTWLRNQFGDWAAVTLHDNDDQIREFIIKLQSMGLTLK